MSDPEERMKHARRRQRNYLAKKLREDSRFKPKRIERKRRDDDDGDYRNLDWWLEGRDEEENCDKIAWRRDQEINEEKKKLR